jgi:opacity protein-like surface antigen
VPLHTLRADVDYGVAEAFTTYGTCGVKVWIFKGEILEHDPMAQDKRMLSGQEGRRRAPSDRALKGLKLERKCCNQSAQSSARQFKGRIHGNAKGGTTLNFRPSASRPWSRSASPRARSRPPAAPSPVT